MPNITIVYADCLHNTNLGDFTIAGEFAHMLQSYFNIAQIDSKCVLASSAKGVKAFDTLYSNGIHEVKFDIVALPDLINSNDADNVINFIEVGICSGVPQEQLQALIKDRPIKVLAVANPAFSMNKFKEYIAPRYTSISHHILGLGLEDERVGLCVYRDKFETIKHADYKNVTCFPYGFMYFNKVIKCSHNYANSHHFVKDYIDITQRLTSIQCHNYVLVGDCSFSLEGIKSYIQTTVNSSAVVYDYSNNEVHNLKYEYGNEKTFYSLLDASIKKWGADLGFHHIFNIMPSKLNIVLLPPQLSNKQMCSLTYNAIPLVGVSGLGSFSEAVAFGKIPFCQYFYPNDHWFKNYKIAINKILPASTQLTDFLNSFLWKDMMTLSERKTFADAINDINFSNQLMAFNQKLIKTPEEIGAVFTSVLNAPKVKADSKNNDESMEIATVQAKSQTKPSLKKSFFNDNQIASNQNTTTKNIAKIEKEINIKVWGNKI